MNAAPAAFVKGLADRIHDWMLRTDIDICAVFDVP
jgi:hypothetical protein